MRLIYAKRFNLQNVLPSLSSLITFFKHLILYCERSEERIGFDILCFFFVSF